MNLDVFDIENFNILSDDENYYFFRALNMEDNADIDNGVILDENGNISRIRTDRERYDGESLYSAKDKVSLKEMFDHIKMHHRKDTNCISLSTNANVASLYGRGYYKDKYVIVKVPKKELGEKVYNAGKYMASEILKKIDEYLINEEVDSLTRYYLDAIEYAKTPEQLKEIMENFRKKEIKEEKDFFERGIEYDYSDINSVEYRALSSKQNFEKDKIVAKLNVLSKNIIPNVSNKFLIQTLGNAFSSLEFINYNDIESSNILEIPNTIVDLLALVQQVDENYPLVKELKEEILRMIREKDYSLFSYIYSNKELDTDSEYTIENMYNLTEGYLDFNSAFNLYKKSFYLAKSKLRTLSILEVLNDKVDSKYRDLISYLEEHTYGVEPKIFSRRVGSKMKVSESVTLDIKNSEREMFEVIDKLSIPKLQDIINRPIEFFNYELRNFEGLNLEYQDKETYYANAIIDLFDWSKLNIVKFSDKQRKQLVDKLKESDVVRIYNALKNNGVKEKDIANTLLTIAIKGKDLDNIDIDDTFTVEQLEDYLDYYKINKTKGLKLRSYQAVALSNIDKIFETRNFAAAVLPTGAGKSFVALAEMLEHSDEEILYLAPSDEIVNQIQKYIVDIICDESLKGSEQEKIKTKFKKLKICTYAKLMADKKNGILNNKESDYLHSKYKLIIFDELHRTGAKEWKNGVLELLRHQYKDTKVLGITATPLRDVDNIDTSFKWAKYFGYTMKEIFQNKHLAMNMTLECAISLGYVVNPKVVQCEYNLECDGTLEKIRKRIEDIADSEIKSKQLKKFETLRRKILEADGIEKVIGDNLKPGGNYIVFCPVVDGQGKQIESETGYSSGLSKVTGKQAIEKYQKQLITYLLKYNGITDVELSEETPIQKYIEIAKKYGYEFNYMLGYYGKAKNTRELNKFSKVEPNKIKFMTVMNKLNEGVHLDKIDGIIWLRPLDTTSKILYLQQLGRCIYSIDPNKEIKDEDRPIVIDVANNTLRFNHCNYNRLKEEDLDLMTLIAEWICKHNGRIPDINAFDKIECKYAANLKYLLKKYKEYKENDSILNSNYLSEDEKWEIEAILEIIDSLDLWQTIIPEREKRKRFGDTNSELDYDKFEIAGVLKDYIELEESINRYKDSDSNVIKWFKRIQEYCELYQEWPSGREHEKKTSDGTTSSSLYHWLSDTSCYISGNFKYNDIKMDGIPIKQILDELYEKYNREYKNVIKWIKRIQEYCQTYHEWPGGKEYDKKTSDGTTSNSLYHWLYTTSCYVSGNFKYNDIKMDGIPIKQILDELYEKYNRKYKNVIKWIKRIQEYCQTYHEWPSKNENNQKVSDGTTSSSLYHWLCGDSCYTSGNFKYNDIKMDGVSVKEILDELYEKYKDYKIVVKWIKRIQEYCQTYHEWPGGKEYDKKTSDGITSNSLYQWLSTISGYTCGNFKYNDIKIDDMPIKIVLDNLYKIYAKSVKNIQENDKNYNLKYASKSSELAVKIYPMFIKLENLYNEKNMEEFNLVFNEMLKLIDSEGLNIEASSLIRLVILPDEQKLEFCMKEYMNNSIQNNVDEASLYKALYNYYSVLKNGNNSFKKSSL